MSLSATSGFFPNAGAKALPGTAGGKPAAGGPFGLFDALLGKLTGGTDAPAGAADPLATITALLNQQQPPAETGEPEPDADGLLPDLLDALSALQIALENGTPLDPALENQANALLESLAGLLGIPLPAPTPAEAVAPALGTTASAAPDAAADLPGALGGPAADDATDRPDLLPQLKELADKLLKLAQNLGSSAPGLSERLAALGAGLESGDIDPTLLAQLLGKGADAKAGGTAIDPALLQTLAAAPRAEPPPFGKPQLAPPALEPDDIEKSPADLRKAEGHLHKPSADGDAPADIRIANRADAATRPAAAADPSQPAVQPNGTAATAAAPGIPSEAKAVHAAYAAPVRQINIPQVAFEIVRQVQAGNSRFQIRLDPPELGRIDVKLDLDAAGNVHARMTVDRAETLDLMQRDHRALERALAQAGLDASRTNLEFSLRQNPSGQHGHPQQGGGSGSDPGFAATTRAETEAVTPAPSSPVLTYRGAASPGGLNLFV